MDHYKQNYYLLANLARSYDDRHTKKNIPHIIMSCYYTHEDVDVPLLVKLKLDSFMIVRIIDSMELTFTRFKISEDNQVECVISLGALLTLNGLDLFQSFIQSIFGTYYQKGKSKEEIDKWNMSMVRDQFESKYGINNILFVFENLQWFNVKHLFDNINVKVSGGSITRRQLISTTDFNLIKFLIRLGYKHSNIYSNMYFDKSHRKLDYGHVNVDVLDETELRLFESQVLEDKVHYIMDELDESCKELKFLIMYLKKEISLLTYNESENKQSMEKYYGANSYKESDLDSFNKKIKDINMVISHLDSNLNLLNKLKLSFTTSSYSEIITIHNVDDIYLNCFNRRKYISKINSKNKYDFIDNFIIGINNNWISSNNIKEKKGKFTWDKLGTKNYSTSQGSKVNSSIQNKLNVNLDKVLSNFSQSRIKSFNLGSSFSNKRQYQPASSLYVKRDYSTVQSIKKLNFNIDSPIFIELQRIMNTSPLDENTQLKIEQFLNDQGSLLLKRRIDQNLDINYYKLNPSVMDYLRKHISELEKLLDNYRTNISSDSYKNITKRVEILLITGLSNEIIISQLLGRLIRIISNNNLSNKNTSCTSLSIDLANSLLYIFYSQEHKNSKFFDINNSLSNFIDLNYSEFNRNLSDGVLAYIGLKLLNLLEEVGLIKSEIYVSSKDLKNLIFVCNSTILEYLNKNNLLLNISYKLPMIVKPKPYSKDLNTGKDTLGGYLLNDVKYVSPLIIKNSELKEQSQILKKNIIIDVINNLSSVGYKINIPVLNFILENGLNYELLTDPDFVHPLEIKKKQKKKLTLSEKKTLDAFLSIKQLEMNILGLALIFKNIPEFFIPVRIDNRGRIYCMADYLNYQGIELAKSLLLFSKGEKISKSDKISIDFLKIFGANCFGNGIDKKSFNDRVEWVNQNESDILNFTNGKLIKDADSKLLFIAFCFEYINYIESLNNNDTYYLSHFPIQLDATCNGYQHLSLLTGDEPLAGELNLISGDNDTKPNDFYSFVGLKINDYINHKKSEALINREDNIKLIESCDRLLGMKMNRSLVKLAIMVKPYNAGLLTMIEYIKDNFEKINSNETNEVFYMLKNNQNILLNNYDFLFFVRTLEEVIYNEFPKLKEFNIYLNEIAQICYKLNIPITWVLPSGLNVFQNYLNSEAIRLKPFKYRKNTYNLKIKTNTINKRKQIRALMPNLIHSLDAASLCLIVDMFNQCYNSSNRINFFCIHDCFAVTANNLNNLIKIIKLVYIKIYSEDSYLKRFDQGIIDSIKLQFGNESFNDKTKTISVNGLNIKYPNVDTVISGRIKASLINKANSIIN